MSMYSEIIETVLSLCGHEYLHMDHALVVTKTPNSIPCSIWAISVSPRLANEKHTLYLMDGNEQWDDIKDEQENDLIISQVYARVSSIKDKYITNSNRRA